MFSTQAGYLQEENQQNLETFNLQVSLLFLPVFFKHNNVKFKFEMTLKLFRELF